MAPMFHFLPNHIRRIEPTAPTWQLLLCALGACLGRIWLEHIIYNDRGYGFYYIHYLSWLSATIAGLILITHFCHSLPLRAAIRWTLLLTPVLCLAPIFDWVLWPVLGKPKIGYMYEKLLYAYGTYFGPLEPGRISAGMRLELFAILLTLGVLTRAYGRSWLRTVATVWAAYSWCFLMLALTGVAAVSAKILGLDWDKSDYRINAFGLCHLLAPALIIGVALARHPKETKAAITGIRLSRTLLYLGIAAIGFAATKPTYSLQSIYQTGIAAVCLLLAWAGSVITNNCQDIAADKHQDEYRPTLDTALNQTTYQTLGIGALILAIYLGWATNSKLGAATTAFVLAYAAYSLPPLKLKRLPVASKFLIGLAGLAAYNIGQSTEAIGYIHFPQLIDASGYPPLCPKPVATYFMVVFSLAANVIDLKDIAADRKAGIHTLANSLPPRLSKAIISLFLVAANLCAVFVFHQPALLPVALLISLFVVALVCKPNYNERWILWALAASHWILAFRALNLF